VASTGTIGHLIQERGFGFARDQKVSEILFYAPRRGRRRVPRVAGRGSRSHSSVTPVHAGTGPRLSRRDALAEEAGPSRGE
jgi:hypothetical protein